MENSDKWFLAVTLVLVLLAIPLSFADSIKWGPSGTNGAQHSDSTDVTSTVLNDDASTTAVNKDQHVNFNTWNDSLDAAATVDSVEFCYNVTRFDSKALIHFDANLTAVQDCCIHTPPAGSLKTKCCNLSNSSCSSYVDTVGELNAFQLRYRIVTTTGQSTQGTDLDFGNLNVTYTPPNYAPRVMTNTIEDDDASVANEIDLEPGRTKSVECTGTVTDNNGDTDITSVNATFHYTASATADENLTNNYKNTSCDITTGFGNSTEASYICGFNVIYYAHNETWTCNVTASDGTLENSTTDTTVVTTLIATNLVTESIDFGNLNLGDSTGTTNEAVTIENIGNVPIDLNLDAFTVQNNTDDTNALDCTTGAVPTGNVYFSETGNIVSLGSADAEPFLATGKVNFPGFSLNEQRQGVITTPTSDIVYLGIEMPSSAAGGNCNGYILFEAIPDS